MARGPGTLGGADRSRWGERTQTAEQRAGAGLCAVNSTASLAIGHQLLATVLVFPGHLSPRIQPGLLKRNLQVPQFALMLHCYLP